MSLIFRLGGAVLLLCAALLISREYKTYLDRRILAYRGIVALIAHAERKISRSLSYGRELWEDFFDEELERVGFIRLLQEGARVGEAFDSISEKLCLTEQTRGRIADFLAKFGGGYREGELSRLRDMEKTLKEEMEAEALLGEKNYKIARALLVGGVLTFAILVI